MSLLASIRGPEDVKALAPEQLPLLAREIRDRVQAAFGITLVPEPVLLGCSL